MYKYIFLFFIFIGLVSCGSSPTVKSAKASLSSVEATVSSVNSGTVKAEQVAELAFGAMGRVKKLNIKLGDSVETNNILAELENDDMKSALVTAEKELKRQQSLISANISSKTNLDLATQNFEMAKAQYERSLIRAPFSGIIAELNLEEGQLSQTTAVMPLPPMKIVDTAPRYINAQIDEVDLSKVTSGLDARIKILAVRKEPFKGKVRKVIPYISTIREQDRTSQIELNIMDEGILLPVGASADVEIITDYKEGVLSVPARTILGRGEEKFVFLNKNGKATKTLIKIGIRNYDVAEIVSGLSVGDEVIFPNDLFEITEGMSIKTETVKWP